MQVESPQGQVGLRDYLDILSRRRWMILGVVVLAVGAALALVLLQQPTYQSSVRLIIEPVITGDETPSAVQQHIDTQREVVSSLGVARAAADYIGADDDPSALLRHMVVQIVKDTQVLEIRATAATPERAAAIADAFAQSYLSFRRDQALERATDAATAIQQRVDRTRDRLDELADERETASPQRQREIDQEEAALLAQLGQQSVQLSSLQNPGELVRGGGEIIRPAEVPSRPATPKPVSTLALALLGGLVLGVGAAFVRDVLDDSVQNDEQVQNLTGAPVVGHIPQITTRRGREVPALITLTEPGHPAGEAFRTLRTNVAFLNVARKRRSLLVTSVAMGEGKTTVATNLAIAAAQAGTRVVLIDGDVRRPRVHERFGQPNGPGLSDVLLTGEDPARFVVDVGIENLRIMTAGQKPPNGPELLGSRRMGDLLADLEDVADLVLIDGPPVLGLADALNLSALARGTLLVIDVNGPRSRNVRSTAQRLAAVGGSLAGIVLTRMDARNPYYFYDSVAYNEVASPSFASRLFPSRSPSESADEVV